MLQAALKKRVIVEEENLQGYKRKKKQEKVRHWKEKPYTESLSNKYQI